MTPFHGESEPMTTNQLLRSPSTYSPVESSVEVVETHISWIFLTSRFAYKLKKPVQFPFLDYSTIELRRRACLRELKLNRRLSRDVYLSVVPVTKNGRGRIRLAGSGTPIDWVVKMRRLSAENTLESLLATGRLRECQVAELSQLLVNYFVSAPPVTIRPEDYRSRLRAHIKENEQVLVEHAPTDLERINRIHRSQLRFLRVAEPILDLRACDGRIIDGHGDLRPEHVYFESEPMIIDCLEFNDELRQLDVTDEICFLAMECERLGNSQVGARILDEYSQRTSDHPPASLLGFYKSYRACVRAKVAAIKAAAAAKRPCGDRRVATYLQLADQYARNQDSPWVIAIHGLMGTGKSTLAKQVASALHCKLLQTDVIRREMYGISSQPADYGTDHYGKHERVNVYGQMFERASKILESEYCVILDGTFAGAEARNGVTDLANQAAADLIPIRCHCPKEVALARIQDRLREQDAPSEARPELYDQQAREVDRSTPMPNELAVDTSQGIASQVQQVVERIRMSLGISV